MAGRVRGPLEDDEIAPVLGDLKRQRDVGLVPGRSMNDPIRPLPGPEPVERDPLVRQSRLPSLALGGQIEPFVIESAAVPGPSQRRVASIHADEPVGKVLTRVHLSYPYGHPSGPHAGGAVRDMPTVRARHDAHQPLIPGGELGVGDHGIGRALQVSTHQQGCAGPESAGPELQVEVATAPLDRGSDPPHTSDPLDPTSEGIPMTIVRREPAGPGILRANPLEGLGSVHLLHPAVGVGATSTPW